MTAWSPTKATPRAKPCTPGRGRRTPFPGSRADTPARTASGRGRAGPAPPSPSPSPRRSTRSRGSSRTECLARREAQRHEGRRRRRGGALPLPAGRIWAHRARSRARAAPRRRGSASAALWLEPRRIHRQQPVEPPPATARSSAAAAFGCGCTLRSYLNAVATLGTTRRTVFRETFSPAADLLDRPTAHVKLPAHPRDRVHALHPLPLVQNHRTGTAELQRTGGQFMKRRSRTSRGQHSMPIHGSSRRLGEVA